METSPHLKKYLTPQDHMTKETKWVHPTASMLDRDRSIGFIVDQRQSAYDLIQASKEIVELANVAISERMREMDQDSDYELPREALTPNQAKGLDYVCEFYKTNGYSPTVQELCEGIGWGHRNSGNVVVVSLVAKGYIKKSEHKWRGIIPMFDSHQQRINHNL